MFSKKSEEKSCQKILDNLTNLRDKLIYPELKKIESEIKKLGITSYDEMLKIPYIKAKEELYRELSIVNQILMKIENPKKLIEEKNDKESLSFEMSFFMIHIDLLKKDLNHALGNGIDKTAKNIIKQTKEITQKTINLVDALKKLGNQAIINDPNDDFTIILYLKSKGIEPVVRQGTIAPKIMEEEKIAKKNLDPMVAEVEKKQSDLSKSSHHRGYLPPIDQFRLACFGIIKENLDKEIKKPNDFNKALIQAYSEYIKLTAPGCEFFNQPIPDDVKRYFDAIKKYCEPQALFLSARDQLKAPREEITHRYR